MAPRRRKNGNCHRRRHGGRRRRKANPAGRRTSQWTVPAAEGPDREVALAPTAPRGSDHEAAEFARFDVGTRDVAGVEGRQPSSPPARRPAAEARDIPWGYGQDRVTAMARDPWWLFAYWEATDTAVARAREVLGPAGRDAWGNLRVYDTTWRLFDGTNANSYFDIPVDRDTRNYYIHIGRPGSTHTVEFGMKSSEGFFSKIARSGPVEMPRDAASPDGRTEWMTVEPAADRRAQFRFREARACAPAAPCEVRAIEERIAGEVGGQAEVLWCGEAREVDMGGGAVLRIFGPWEVRVVLPSGAIVTWMVRWTWTTGAVEGHAITAEIYRRILGSSAEWGPHAEWRTTSAGVALLAWSGRP